MDFLLAAVALEKSQRFEKIKPVGDRYRDLSGLFKLLENFAGVLARFEGRRLLGVRKCSGALWGDCVRKPWRCSKLRGR